VESPRYQEALLALVRSRDEDLDGALRTLTRVDAETLGVERVSVWFFDEDGTELDAHTLYRLSEDAYGSGSRLRADYLPRYFAALQEHRAIAAHDAISDPATAEFAEDYLRPLGITSMLDVPIWMGGEMVGVLCHEHTGPARRWTAEEQDFATSIADMVSLALVSDERRSTEVALRRMADRMRAVAEAAANVIGAGSFDALQEVLREACRKVIPFDAFTFALYDADAHVFQFLRGYDRGEIMGDMVVPAAGSPSERVVRERRSLVVLSTEDPAGQGALLSGSQRRSESVIRSPICSGEQVLGVLAVHSYTPGQYSPDDVEVLEALASLAATAIVSLRLAAERETAVRALRASEASYRAIFDSTSEGIYIHDFETGAIVDVNPRACEIHGLTPEEFRIMGPAALASGIPPYTREAAIEHLERARHSPQRFEWQFRHRSGRLGWLEVNLQRVMIDGTDRMLATTRDITDRKEAGQALLRAYDELERRVEERTAELAIANEALRKSEQHFRRLIENASDIVAIIDDEGIMRYQSPVMFRVLGYTDEDMIGRSAFEHFHPDDVGPAVAALGRIVDNPAEAQSAVYRFRHRDGSWRTLESLGRSLSPESTRDGVVLNSRDITGRMEAEEALRRAKDEAERAREAAEAANRAKSDFLSRMSHELRTPMNSILGFGQLLARKELPADQRKAVDHIMKAGQHLLNLINEVLDIARIEANRQELSPEPVRVRTALQEALSLIRPLAAQHATEVDPEVGIGGDAYVQADRQRFAQVLLNLLSNAVKYNRPGGRVWLTCEARGERLRITVHDTGRGIAEDRLLDLFIPFARLGAERSDVEGTGLGLALSKRLVEAMNGTIGVESEVDEGSRFWIELEAVEGPVERVLRTGGLPAAPTDDHTARPATLLYIEDNLANLSLVEAILAGHPEVKLIPALQGQLGIDLAVQHRPDLILLDLNLPDMPGSDVLRRLRANPATSTTPVIVISADATPGSIQRMREAGARGYLTKPMDVDEFLHMLELALHGD
jgi:PAS domain S-box-containing protein